MSHREPSRQRPEVCVELANQGHCCPHGTGTEGQAAPHTSATSVSPPNGLPSSVAAEQPGQNQTLCPLRVSFQTVASFSIFTTITFTSYRLLGACYVSGTVLSSLLPLSKLLLPSTL